MSDGTPSPAPLAARPPAGTAAAVPGTFAVPALKELDANGERKPFWARLDSPFAVGFLLTLGGLGAVLLGIALTNIATIIIYIALAMFASLGLDPVLKWLGRHNIKRPWAILIIFFIFGVL